MSFGRRIIRLVLREGGNWIQNRSCTSMTMCSTSNLLISLLVNPHFTASEKTKNAVSSSASAASSNKALISESVGRFSSNSVLS